MALHWNTKECVNRPHLTRHTKKYVLGLVKEHHSDIDFEYGKTELKAGIPFEVYLWWDKDEGCYVRRNHVTNTLIWGSMMIDIGEITEENVWEVYRRYQVWNRLGHCRVYIQSWEEGYDDDLQERNITFDDIYSHIGLKTNVGNTSKAKFKSRVATWIMEKANEGVSSERYKREVK